MRPLRDAVVVVTGASSGIGRATVHELLGRGARVLAAARGTEALTQLADECTPVRTALLTQAADVAHPEDVDAIAATAMRRFGRIDAWVNNAAVGVWGPLDEIPLEVFRRVMDVNLFGYVYGINAALRIMRPQGEGVIVNVASLAGCITHPYSVPYAASKHAVRALSLGLRQELLLERSPIKVTTVLPATIDTPFFRHAANYSGRAAHAMPPVYAPEQVARTIVRGITRPRREVFVGGAGRMLAQQWKLMPGLTERELGLMTDRRLLRRDEPVPASSGTVLTPPTARDEEVEGGWHGAERTRMRRAAVAVAASGAATAITLLRRRQHAAA